jgi:hypothetical protein
MILDLRGERLATVAGHCVRVWGPLPLRSVREPPIITPLTQPIGGSPDSGVVETSADEDHPEPVVGGVAVAAGDPAVQFDKSVDRFGGSVVRPAGGEVGQGLVGPSA